MAAACVLLTEVQQQANVTPQSFVLEEDSESWTPGPA